MLKIERRETDNWGMAEATVSYPTGGSVESRSLDVADQADRAAGGADTVGDLLMLTSLACDAALVLLARPRPAGGWSVDFDGQTRQPPNTPELFEQITASGQPVEIQDLLSAFPGTPLVAFPSSMRWAYGIAIRDENRNVLAVVVIVDRWLRTLTRREQRVIYALARRINAHLTSPATTGNGGIAETALPETPSTVAQPPKAATAGAFLIAPEVPPRMLRTSEVAALFDVTERTVVNWAASGKLPSIRTIGGHRRFRNQDVTALCDMR